jgi:hypothetical protein
MIIPIINGRQYTPFDCYLDHHHKPRGSTGYYCPHCGDVWARLINPKSSQWVFYAADCEKHPTAYNTLFGVPAGSICKSYDLPLLDALPLDLLRREVLLLRSS